MNREDVVRKIQKALALAGNNPSEQEAQTAMLMAQRLMAEHNIHMTEVADAKSAEERSKVEQKRVVIKEILWWKKRLAAIIADNFRCYSTVSPGRSVNFLGMEEDVELCEMVYVYAMTSIIYLSKKYIRENVQKGVRAYAVPLKNAYITGFLEGLREAFRRQIADSGSMALVLVKPDQLVRHYEGLRLRKGAPTREVTGHDRRAIAAGYQDGLEFDHSSKVIQ